MMAGWRNRYMKTEEWLYPNGFGGFSQDGKEYQIHVTEKERTPVPWSHILASKTIGTLVTSNGGGFTWYQNSRENKLTTWSNDVVGDPPSETITLQDETQRWSATSDYILPEEAFTVIYGFGYATYRLESPRYEQELTIWVTEKPAQKRQWLRLKNKQETKQTIQIQYQVEAVLGVAREYTKKHLVVEPEDTGVKVSNRYQKDYGDYQMHLAMLIEENGKQRLAKAIPEEEGIGVSMSLTLSPGEECFVFCGMSYQKEEEMVWEGWQAQQKSLEETKEMWRTKLSCVQVKTPVVSMNIMLNGWLLYQTLTSRVWGRASFYQSGGAYGFRDQLQDMLAVLYCDPAMVREQILYHAAHQFPEGDVLHWWHPERNNGIRTRFSDDALWLGYLTYEYVTFTGDDSILWEKVPFVTGRMLQEQEDEIYIETKPSEETATLMDHLHRAYRRSLEWGEHGLPKMGSGDWNDGMNTVGGESVWLGFFLADGLRKLLDLEKEATSSEAISYFQSKAWQQRKERYQIKYEELKKNVNEAWDGRWYKRAYFKSGEALGSHQNDECKIDNISQSWSVISGVGEEEKQRMAMESVETYLVDHENQLIRLLTPAFCYTKLEPGYIKSYLPGIRENGGQYTHGAIWAIFANAKLQQRERATEYFRMLNPIEHTRTREEVMKYKAEPYVIVADIYSHPHLLGRGGWSWYTGSSSWYFVAGIKAILGLCPHGETLTVVPQIPSDWHHCEICYRRKETTYQIQIEQEEEQIPLDQDQKEHTIVVKIKKE